MFTEQEWRAMVYRGAVFDAIDRNGRKHDERGWFSKQGGGANRTGIEPEKKVHAAKVLHGAPVAALQSADAPHGYPALREWASALFKQAGGKAVSPELGEVALDDRAVRDSMAHGMNPFKAVAFAAVPAVIEKGVRVLTGTDGNQDSHYISAPVRIDGVDDIVTVLVHQNPKTRRMYLHSVATKESLLKARDSGTDAGRASECTSKVTSGDVASVLHGLLKFKESTDGD